MTGVEVRPLLPEDLEAARVVADVALRTLAEQQGWHHPVPSEAGLRRARRRFAHLQATDPDGCFVAESTGDCVGVALSLRRGPLWFLSLLAVAPGQQGRGTGRLLLDAALRTADGPAMIMSSSDAKALRRYGAAGFDLHPGYTVGGTVDRALLPATPLVREGDLARDADLVERLARDLRGAPYGPDLAVFADVFRLLVVPGRGWVFLREGLVSCLGATDPEAATALLWAALAETGERAEVESVTAGQQWAVRVALQARLTVVPDVSVCVRGGAVPSPLHLPSGVYG